MKLFHKHVSHSVDSPSLNSKKLDLTIETIPVGMCLTYLWITSSCKKGCFSCTQGATGHHIKET